MPESIEASIDAEALRAAVRAALEEDRAWDDVTTHAVVPPGRAGRARIEAREAGVVAGLPVARAVFRERDPSVAFSPAVEEGERVEVGAVLARLEGPFEAILSAERVALNFLGRLSGVATATRRYVEAVPPGAKTVVLETRKTTPGLRAFERYAVRVGGGGAHRGDLASAVLVKDTHAAVARSVQDATLAAMQTMTGQVPIWVEVHSLDDLADVLAVGPDRILLDNLSDAEIEEAVRRIGGACEVEVSGRLTPERVRRLAGLGVDYVSVGAITRDAPWLDVALEVE